MAEGHVDVKRYQIISLLYIVFICFSVISIKITILDSNIYTIKSLQSIDKEENKKLNISNKIIDDNKGLLKNKSKAQAYLKIRSRLKISREVVESVLKYVDDEFDKNKTSILKQFNSKNLIEEILKSDKGVKLLEKDLFELSDFIKKSPYKLQTSLDSLIPIEKNITTIKGKVEPWEYYLFMHKPTAISYMQLERIKLLITKIIEFDNIKKKIFKYVEKLENGITTASTIKRIIQKENKKRLINNIELIDTKEKYDKYAEEWGLTLSNQIENVKNNNWVELLRPDFNDFIKQFYTWDELETYLKQTIIPSIAEFEKINNNNKIPNYSLIESGMYNENKNEKALVNILYKKKVLSKF